MYDEEIEKAVLYYIIFENEEFEIEENDFVNNINKNIAVAINKLKDKKENISMLSVKEEIEKEGKNKSGMLEYIAKIGDYVYGTTAETVYNKLIQLSKKRKIYNLAKKIINEIENEEVDVYMQKIIEQINKIADRKLEEKSFVTKILETTVEIEHNCRNSSDYSLYTGILDLDNIICGLHNQELTIIGARPGMGKTTLALQIAEKIACNNKNVLFVSLEMSETQLIQKMIAQTGNIKSYRMRMGTVEDDDWKKIKKAVEELALLNFNINSKIRTIQQLEFEARRLKNKNKLDLLVIDYIQLMKSKDKFSIREQEVADISRRLKLMSLELNIPILALCQLNRNASNNEPSLNELRESGSLEQDADNIIFIYKEKQESDLTTLKVAKQRAGETGKAVVAFRKDISTFVNVVWK